MSKLAAHISKVFLISLIILLSIPLVIKATVPSTTNLEVWYRASDLTCTSGCSGTHAVTGWTDKSSHMNNLAVQSGLASANYHASAINGQPAVQFASNMPNQGYVTGAEIAALNPGTICEVIKMADTGTKRSLVSGNSGSLLNYFGNPKMEGADKNSVDNLGDGTASADTSAHSFCMDYDGATLHFFMDGSADGTISVAHTITQTTYVIGCNWQQFGCDEAFHGDLADLVIYSKVLSSGERTTWFTYTTERYNIPAAAGGGSSPNFMMMR